MSDFLDVDTQDTKCPKCEEQDDHTYEV